MYKHQNAARNRKRCEKQKEHKCPNCHFYREIKEEMDYQVSKKHAQPSSKQSTVCTSWEQEFSIYYSLQQHRRKEHEAKRRKDSDIVADLNKIVGKKGKMVKSSILPLKSTLLRRSFFQIFRLANFDISTPMKITLKLKTPFALY